MSKSPFIPFPHCLRCPISQPCALARLPSWDRWLIPTEGFKEASGLSHIPHPLPVQPGLPYPRMPGSQVGLEGSLLSLPLPASHWTYNSGTEPCSRCPPNLVLEGDKPRRARDPPHPRSGKERGWHLGIFWLWLCLSPPPCPCSTPSSYSPFPYFPLFRLSVCGSESLLLSLLGLPCPTLAQGGGGRVSHPNHPPPPPSSPLVIKDKIVIL